MSAGGNPKRIAILSIHLESNSFAPVCDEAAFRELCYLAGDEILADLENDNPTQPAEVGGFVSEMNRLGVAWVPVPILVTAAEPGGPVDHAFLSATLAEMERRLTGAMPLDGVYASLHGAMISTESDDPDGELLAMIRRVVGVDAPLIATLDLHANISERMVAEADILVAYRTNPHIDQEARAAEAARLMLEMFDGMRPETAFIRLPICAPTTTLLTAEGAYADMIDLGQKAKTGAIANVSAVAGFIYGNSVHNGISVIVTARGDLAAARSLSADVAALGWNERERFQKPVTSLEDAVEMAVANGRDPSRPALIFADSADNPGGGGRGNTAWILRALVDAGAEDVLFGNFIDPALVRAAQEAGEGAAITARFNTETESEFSKPFEADARVLKLSDGVCVGRRGIWKDRAITLGPSALLELGGIRVVVATMRKQCADPVFFEMFGLDIADARTVVVKSRGHFRAGFDEFFTSEQVIEVDAPGLTSPVLSRFDFNNLPRPVFPLDQDATWDGPGW